MKLGSLEWVLHDYSINAVSADRNLFRLEYHLTVSTVEAANWTHKVVVSTFHNAYIACFSLTTHLMCQLSTSCTMYCTWQPIILIIAFSLISFTLKLSAHMWLLLIPWHFYDEWGICRFKKQLSIQKVCCHCILDTGIGHWIHASWLMLSSHISVEIWQCNEHWSYTSCQTCVMPWLNIM